MRKIKSLRKGPESAPGPMVRRLSKKPLAALVAWDAMAKPAYSANTQRAWKADGAVFQAFCESVGFQFFPATPQTVRAFIIECQKLAKKPATIRRYVATITRAHAAAGLVSPCESEPVRLALKEMSQKFSARQRQAYALGWAEIKDFVQNSGDGLRAERERALLCMAYDTMARRSELVALDLEDLALVPNGTGTVLIRRSKTDTAGQGATAYLSRETVRHLQVWLASAGITEGPLFRRLIGQRRIGERLHADIIADIYKRVAAYIGMPSKRVAQVSGHSIRVGATQDLLALNIDLASVMQAGRWKSTAMPMRYGEEVLAARGGMAKAAQAQGRDVP